MPLLWLGLSFTSGILCAWLLDLPSVIWQTLAAIAIFLTAFEIYVIPRHAHPLRNRSVFRITIGLVLLGFAAGGWRFQSALPRSFTAIDSPIESIENAVVFGKIVSFPDRSGRLITADVQVEKIVVRDDVYRMKDHVLLRMPGRFNLQYGDQLVLAGMLEPLIDTERRPLISYYASSGFTWQMDFPDASVAAYDQGNPFFEWIYGLREKAYQDIFKWMPFPENALLSGILLGIDWNMPELLIEAYRSTSTLHIIAISGFNIAVVAAIFTRLFRRILPPYWDGACAVIAIAVYTIFVGADPTVVRAAWMALIALPAYYIGRRAIGINLLSTAAMVMLAGNPLLLWNISFQLSFLATLGLMTLADPLIGLFNRFLGNFFSDKMIELASPVLMLFATTMAAQFSVFPVIFRLDSSFNLLALPANLLILPLQPPLMIVGGLAVILGAFFPQVGSMLAVIAWLPAALSNRIALRFSMIPRRIFTLPDWSWIPASVLVFLTIVWMSIRQIKTFEQPDGLLERNSK